MINDKFNDIKIFNIISNKLIGKHKILYLQEKYT